MFDPQVETRDPAEQRQRDEALYKKQIEYLFERSPFYRKKFAEAGFKTAKSVGDLSEIGKLPFTVKEDIRATQAECPPLGAHLAADPKKLVRTFSTSGTTGTPCYIAVTHKDLYDVWAVNTARSYTACGFRPGQGLVVAFNIGPFVAGGAYAGYDLLGASVIPIGTGNTERLVKAFQHLGATGLACTPSYALYLIDWCSERDIDPLSLGIKNMATAGEPGGGEAAIRGRVESAFGCTMREAMGTGDISTSVWGECEHEGGMHYSARDNSFVELIDPQTEQPVPWEDGAEGELIYTALVREAQPVVRIRSRDHVVVRTEVCACGRNTPRIRCIGRTDDMLIVRGVNLFPTAVRSLLNDFQPDIGGTFRITPNKRGVSQDPPLPIKIELGKGVQEAPSDLAERIQASIRAKLLVASNVILVPYGSLPREEYKSKLLDYSEAVD